MPKVLKDSVKIILISLAVSFSVYLALAQAGIWSEPVATPPEGNLPAPLTLDSQGNLKIPGSLEVGGNFNITTNAQLIDYTYNLNTSTNYPVTSSPVCACDTTLSSVDCPAQFNSGDQGAICYDQYSVTAISDPFSGSTITRRFKKGYLRNSGNYTSTGVLSVKKEVVSGPGGVVVNNRLNFNGILEGLRALKFSDGSRQTTAVPFIVREFKNLGEDTFSGEICCGAIKTLPGDQDWLPDECPADAEGVFVDELQTQWYGCCGGSFRYAYCHRNGWLSAR